MNTPIGTVETAVTFEPEGLKRMVIALSVLAAIVVLIIGIAKKL